MSDYLVKVLLSGKQCDEDGVMCIVSRQACHKAAARIRELEAEMDRKAVKVKPLEWRGGHAHGVGHHYFTRDGCLYRGEFLGETGLHCGPAREIERVAQADYERRIMSALQTDTDTRDKTDE